MFLVGIHKYHGDKGLLPPLSDNLEEVKVGYDFGEIKPSLLDHPIGTNVLEAVFGLHVVKTVVNGWWWCGVRVGLDGLSTLRA